MELLIEKVPLWATILLGASVLIYIAVNLLWKAIDKILGLLKFSKILIQYARHKGKCKECRKNDVYTPRINKN